MICNSNSRLNHTKNKTYLSTKIQISFAKLHLRSTKSRRVLLEASKWKMHVYPKLNYVLLEASKWKMHVYPKLNYANKMILCVYINMKR